MPRQAISLGRQLRRSLARSSLTSPSVWCLRFLPTLLASVLLASEAAQSQTVGPGLVTTPITGNQDVTVVGSTQLIPQPAGSVAVNPSGSATVTFDPGAAPTPGPISVDTQNARAIVITGGTQLAINPFGSPFLTTITTTGTDAYAINVVSGNHTEVLNNVAISTSGADAIRIENPNNIINATGVTVTTTGAGASALALISGGGSTANFTNSTLTSEAGPVIRVEMGDLPGKNINLTDTSVTAGSGDGRWLYVTRLSTPTNVTASYSTLTGAAITDPGSISNVVLQGDTTWHLTGDSNVTNLTNDVSTIDFAPPVGGAFKTLTTVNYVGVGGTIGLNTFLGTDNSPSDKLVINGGSGSGSTTLLVRNTGGPGAETVSNGILVVQAISGGTTTPTAFSLAGGRVTAGAFDYFLFRGGVTPGTQDSWFLRNAIVAPPVTPPGTTPPGTTPPGTTPPGTTPPELIPTPTPAPGTPPLPTPVPGAPPIPLYDPEVALKSVVPSVARTLGLVTLGTFNERQGDQLLLRGDDLRVGGWGRVFGQQTREHFAQGARPDFDGTFAGFQAGADLLRWESSNGHRDHIGFYVAETRASGSVHGSVDGFEGALAGHADLDAMSYAGYWTHLGPSNWYIDAVVQWTHIHGSPLSIRGVSNDIRGRGLAGSIEAGYPIAVMPWLTFEPQIQGIWQRVSLDDTQDPFSTITFDRANVFIGRAGALLRGSFGSTGALWQPYLKGNVWWGSNGFDTVRFDADPIQTGRNGGITLEGGGGVTGQLARNVSIYGDASYLSSVSGESRITLKGNVGLRVTW
jgi:outer membrane autotransporter protein